MKGSSVVPLWTSQLNLFKYPYWQELLKPLYVRGCWSCDRRNSSWNVLQETRCWTNVDKLLTAWNSWYKAKAEWGRGSELPWALTFYIMFFCSPSPSLALRLLPLFLMALLLKLCISYGFTEYILTAILSTLRASAHNFCQVLPSKDCTEETLWRKAQCGKKCSGFIQLGIKLCFAHVLWPGVIFIHLRLSLSNSYAHEKKNRAHYIILLWELTRWIILSCDV